MTPVDEKPITGSTRGTTIGVIIAIEIPFQWGLMAPPTTPVTVLRADIFVEMKLVERDGKKQTAGVSWVFIFGAGRRESHLRIDPKKLSWTPTSIS
jgi:hypothetical protein